LSKGRVPRPQFYQPIELGVSTALRRQGSWVRIPPGAPNCSVSIAVPTLFWHGRQLSKGQLAGCMSVP